MLADEAKVVQAESVPVSAPVEAATAATVPEEAHVPLTDTAIEGRIQGTATPAGRTTGTIDTATAQNIRQQVSAQVSSRLEEIVGSQKITIRLNPESLGQVELNFETKDDRLNLVITASSLEAESALQENMKDLADRIVERSARFAQVDVRVEIKDGADNRQDNKQDQKQDSRQDQRRDQSGSHGDESQSGHHQSGQHTRQAQKAWESAMSWQLAEDAANEEG